VIKHWNPRVCFVLWLSRRTGGDQSKVAGAYGYTLLLERTMYVGICTLHLRLLNNHSLKEKRRVVKSIKDRVKNKFNVSIAEVDKLDKWQYATIGVAYVSNSAGLVNSTLSNVVDFIGKIRLAEVVDYEIEIQ